MGWKGTVRSVSASMRAAERESQRRNKQLLKEQVSEEAADAVDDWKSYTHELTSIHTNATDNIDWQEMAASPQPEKPIGSSQHATNAQRQLDMFKSRPWDFLLGGTDKRQDKLRAALAEAIKRDGNAFEQAKIEYEAALIEWGDDVALAKRLLAHDPAAKKEVITEMQSLSGDDLIGSAISFQIGDDGIHAVASVHADDVVPNYRRKQLASGRLSETKMPVGEFNELYQDYVCSVALRVAGDLFGLLPDDEIYVTCASQMLNKQTGHQEQTPILSVQFVRETFDGLNLAQIDPSDSLGNFNHQMGFKRTKGFGRIEPLKNLPE